MRAAAATRLPAVPVNRTQLAARLRSDETLLVNTHVYGSPAAHNPVLRLRRVPGGRVVDHYLTSFDKVWAQARPTTDIDGLIAAFEREA